MENGNKTGGKAMNILQKLYRYRLHITRKDGKTILNWSSLFSLACLLLAPHISIAGIVLSLILGYHINLETDEQDQDFEQRIRQAADTVRKTATAAAQTIRSEIDRNTAKKADTKSAASAPDESAFETPKPAEAAPAEPVQAAAPKAEPTNQDVVQDLEQHAYAFQHNPSARSAFSAVGSSVPTIQVEESAPDDPGKQSQHMY